MFAKLEAEFNTIVADARTIPEKLEALVGLHTKSAELAAMTSSLTTILNEASTSVEQKVEAILTAVGKL